MNHICPILNDYCKGGLCKWWNEYANDCAISLLPNVLTNNMCKTETESMFAKEPLQIVDLNFGTRITNALLRNKITTIDQLCTVSDDELLKIRNLGEKAVREIRTTINLYKTFKSQLLYCKLTNTAAIHDNNTLIPIHATPIANFTKIIIDSIKSCLIHCIIRTFNGLLYS